MKRFQAYKFELRLNGEQERKARSFAGSCRYVYNKALALQIELRKQSKKKLSRFDLCKVLVDWKKEPETL